MKSLVYLANIVLLLIIVLLMGCTASRSRKSADREVYKILNEKSKKVVAEKMSWRIDPGKKEKTPSEPLFLTLKDVLIIAARNNYDYLRRKEDVYLQALALTSQRNRFRLGYSLGGKVSWEKDEEEESAGANLNLNLIKWLSKGPKVTFSISEELLKYLPGEEEETFQTVVSLNLLQPLFRGAGRRIAREDLMQAERKMVYRIRSFLRYQRGFSVDVTSKYLALLQSKHNLKNYENNHLYLKQAR